MEKATSEKKPDKRIKDSLFAIGSGLFLIPGFVLSVAIFGGILGAIQLLITGFFFGESWLASAFIGVLFIAGIVVSWKARRSIHQQMKDLWNQMSRGL